jgi:hypothetical protein
MLVDESAGCALGATRLAGRAAAAQAQAGPLRPHPAPRACRAPAARRARAVVRGLRGARQGAPADRFFAPSLRCRPSYTIQPGSSRQSCAPVASGGGAAPGAVRGCIWGLQSIAGDWDYLLDGRLRHCNCQSLEESPTLFGGQTRFGTPAFRAVFAIRPSNAPRTQASGGGAAAAAAGGGSGGGGQGLPPGGSGVLEEQGGRTRSILRGSSRCGLEIISSDSLACSRRVQTAPMSMWCACGVHAVCMWCACGVHVVCMWCACGVHVVCMWCACSVHVVCVQFARCTHSDTLTRMPSGAWPGTHPLCRAERALNPPRTSTL